MLNEALKAPLHDVAETESKKWDTYDDDGDEEDDYDDEEDDDYDDDDDDEEEEDDDGYYGLEETDFFPQRFNPKTGHLLPIPKSDDILDDDDLGGFDNGYELDDDGIDEFEMEQNHKRY
eukprot:UN09974